jgi:hypothetical protein
MKQEYKAKVKFNTKAMHIAEHCCYGEAYFCDGTVNKSVDGWEERTPKRPCKKKECMLKKETVQFKRIKER